MLGRRGFNGTQLIIVAGAFTLFIYGFYSYHNSQTLLRKTQESLEMNKILHKKEINSITEENKKLEGNIASLKNSLKELEASKSELETSMEQKIKELQERLHEKEESYSNEKAQREGIKIQLDAKDSTIEEFKLKLEESIKKEKQSIQENENEMAQLRDEVANTKRRAEETNKLLEECQSKLPQLNVTEVKKVKKEIEPDMQINEPNRNQDSYFKVKQIKPGKERLEQEKLAVKESLKDDEKQNEVDTNQVMPPVIKHQKEKEVPNELEKKVEEELNENNAEEDDDLNKQKKEGISSNKVMKNPQEIHKEAPGFQINDGRGQQDAKEPKILAKEGLVDQEQSLNKIRQPQIKNDENREVNFGNRGVNGIGMDGGKLMKNGDNILAPLKAHENQKNHLQNNLAVDEGNQNDGNLENQEDDENIQN